MDAKSLVCCLLSLALGFTFAAPASAADESLKAQAALALALAQGTSEAEAACCPCEKGEACICTGGCACDGLEYKPESLTVYQARLKSAMRAGQPLVIWVGHYCPRTAGQLSECHHVYLAEYNGVNGVGMMLAVPIYAGDALHYHYHGTRTVAAIRHGIQEAKDSLTEPKGKSMMGSPQQPMIRMGGGYSSGSKMRAGGGSC